MGFYHSGKGFDASPTVPHRLRFSSSSPLHSWLLPQTPSHSLPKQFFTRQGHLVFIITSQRVSLCALHPACIMWDTESSMVRRKEGTEAEGGGAGARAGNKQRVTLNSADRTWRELRDLSFAAVAPVLSERAKSIQSEYQDSKVFPPVPLSRLLEPPLLPTLLHTRATCFPPSARSCAAFSWW